MSASPVVASLVERLPTSWAGGKAVGALVQGGTLIDRLQQFLGASGDTVQILFRAVVATPIFMVMMGQLSFFSDITKLGIPGRRTYFFTLVISPFPFAPRFAALRPLSYFLIECPLCRQLLPLLAFFSYMQLTQALMIGTVAKQMLESYSGKRIPAAPMPDSYRKPNRIFMMAVLGHFALHTMINMWGKPETHASTGIHQKIKPKTEINKVKDIMGWERNEELHPGGPILHSQHDYSFSPNSGQVVTKSAVEPSPTGLESIWYTVYGKPHKDRAGEFSMGARLAAMGSVAFCIAMRKEL
jgi:hypothetical protein